MAARKPKPQEAPPESPHERNIVWVMEMFSSDEREQAAQESDAPSLEAWALFQQYRPHSKTKRDFMEKFYKPLYSKEKPAEKNGAMSDDQRKFFKLFELLELERPEFIGESLHGSKPSNPVIVPESILSGDAEASGDCRPDNAVVGTCLVGLPGTDAAASQTEV